MDNLEKIFNKTVDKFIQNGILLNEARCEVYLLIEEVFGQTKKDLFINPSKSFSEDEIEKFNRLVSMRINEKIPVQYLINKAYFMSQAFYVDENVLIPRPETELLVEEVLKLPGEKTKIIDIGTGSGCIAIMLAKKLPEADVFASDISENALKIAKINVEKLGVNNRIKFINSNIFEKIDPSEKFDIIVSNPPYISIQEKENLQIEVSGHEPEVALFVEDKTGVSFYEKLAAQSFERLNTGGIIAVEIGIYQSESVQKIFEKNGFANIKVIKDLLGIDRVIIGQVNL